MKKTLTITLTSLMVFLSLNAHADDYHTDNFQPCGIGYVSEIIAGSNDDSNQGMQFKLNITKDRTLNPTNKIGDEVTLKMNVGKNINDRAGAIFYNMLSNAMMLGSVIEAWDGNGTECDDIHKIIVKRT